MSSGPRAFHQLLFGNFRQRNVGDADGHAERQCVHRTQGHGGDGNQHHHGDLPGDEIVRDWCFRELITIEAQIRISVVSMAETKPIWRVQRARKGMRPARILMIAQQG